MQNDSLQTFLNHHDHVIEVELADLKGSSPREVGATIFIAEDATYGTIGGGQLEYMAIDEARRMLRRHQGQKRLTVPLGPEIGQCCGGVVSLHFQLMDHRARLQAKEREARERAQQPNVYIFGSGHVGRALANALSLLPVKIRLIDSRPEELARAAPHIPQDCTPLPEAHIRTAPPASAFIILTHDHALDFLLAREALLRDDAAYVGMIGSRTKRGSFANWLRREEKEQANASLSRLTCPIGRDASKDKRPSVIAAMVAAEVITALELARLSETISK